MSHEEIPESLRTAYDSERFRAAGHRIIDLLANHLSASMNGQQSQALPWIEPEHAVAHWQALAATPDLSIEDICREVLAGSVRISDPKYMGHQICHPAPVAMLAGLITDCVNNGTGVYEMGMAGTAMEQQVIRHVARQFGMDDTSDGFLTSGGTLANLTALLAARSIKSGGNDWSSGTSQRLAVMASTQSHYCVDRAVRVMGWGDSGLIRIPTDSDFQMRTDLLEDYYQTAQQGGVKIIGVVGSACTTSTGTFDDLTAISEFCRAHDLWFHVDGAHGAAVAFSAAQQHRLDGIHMADSVALDFHKMLMTPVITSGVVFRHGEHGFRTFATEADYLFQGQDDAEHDWFNLAKRTFECSKTMMSTKIYSILATHGASILGDNVDRLYELTQQFVALLQQRPEFELATEPQCNIVCFRLRAHPDGDTCALNTAVRDHLTRNGEYYVVQTKLQGQVWLRTTITNPFTSTRDFTGLLDTIHQTAEQFPSLCVRG